MKRATSALALLASVTLACSASSAASTARAYEAGWKTYQPYPSLAFSVSLPNNWHFERSMSLKPVPTAYSQASSSPALKPRVTKVPTARPRAMNKEDDA